MVQLLPHNFKRSGKDVICKEKPEFDPNKKIVQEWYFGEEEAEIPSIVTIKLHEHKQGTSVELRHINIPDDAFEDICEGWDYTYFAELIDFYED